MVPGMTIRELLVRTRPETIDPWNSQNILERKPGESGSDCQGYKTARTTWAMNTQGAEQGENNCVNTTGKEDNCKTNEVMENCQP